MSFRRLFQMGSICCLLFLVAFGCQPSEKPPEKSVAIKKKVKKASPVKNQTIDAAVKEPVPAEFVYEPAGRRDPFVPLLEVKKAVAVDEGPLTPLQTFDVGQLRLAGVVVGHRAPIAMVMVPGGKSYVLKKGDRVGKNHGKVVDITESGVLVKERFYDFSGEIRENLQEISLPKRSGVD
jgi:type IV pilus assembly protein PilP